LVALIVEDGDGHLWVSTTRGIVRLERERIDAVADGRAATLEPVAITRRDGMPHSEGSGGGFDPSGLRDRDGRLWFPTLDGIAMVDPATFPINRRPPRLAIEDVTTGGEPAARAAAGVTIPPGTPAIEIAYTAFSLLDPAKVRFRYRLVGLDDEWTDAAERRVAYYSHLPPATYTFEVLASNNDGIWSTEADSVRLVVMPFWWERGVVRGGGLLALLAATGIAARAVSTRRARARLLELERAHALQRERERIARDLHDELGARLTHIALLADRPKPHDDRTRLTRAVRDAVSTMAELVWSVNARHDTLESFANYAAEFAQEHLEAAGVRFRLDIRPDFGAHVLSAEVRRHLYLAFKEAVNNAVKHARASQVNVTIDLDAGVLVLDVSDNGCGLPAGGDGTRADGSSGNGFGNMRARMRAVGGTFAVDSPAGGGTRLTFRLPLG
jgi:signal transduction histidine kinase